MSVKIRIKVRTLLYAVVALVVVGLVVLNVYAFSRPSSTGKGAVANTPENFDEFRSAENPADKCAVPDGYTEKEWKEHMGHHPELYEECLG